MCDPEFLSVFAMSARIVHLQLSVSQEAANGRWVRKWATSWSAETMSEGKAGIATAVKQVPVVNNNLECSVCSQKLYRSIIWSLH